jgi:hypothetical protein
MREESLKDRMMRPITRAERILYGTGAVAAIIGLLLRGITGA